jgi:hypothetical protein
MGIMMMRRMVIFVSLIGAPWVPGVALAQDVPGIEICTVERTMERRTSCLQSNVNFLQTTISKQALDHQQKLDVAKAQIEGLKAAVVALQKSVAELQAGKKPDEAPAKDAVPAKEAPAKEAPAKDTGPAKDGAK